MVRIAKPRSKYEHLCEALIPDQTKTDRGQTKTNKYQTETDRSQTKTNRGQTENDRGQTKTNRGQTETDKCQTETEHMSDGYICI